MRIGPGLHKGSPFAGVSLEGQHDRIDIVTDVLDIKVKVGDIARFSLRTR